MDDPAVFAPRHAAFLAGKRAAVAGNIFYPDIAPGSVAADSVGRRECALAIIADRLGPGIAVCNDTPCGALLCPGLGKSGAVKGQPGLFKRSKKPLVVSDARLPRTLHRDSLQILGTHDAAHTPPARCPPRSMQDAGVRDEIFPGRPDVDGLESPVSKFVWECPVEGIGPHPPELSGVADFHLAVIDDDVAEVRRLAADHDPVIARKADLGTEKTTHVRVGNGRGMGVIGLHRGGDGGFRHHTGSGRGGNRKPRKRPGHEDQRVFGRKRVDSRCFKPVPEDLHAEALSADEFVQVFGRDGHPFTLAGGKVDVQNYSMVPWFAAHFVPPKAAVPYQPLASSAAIFSGPRP